MGDVDLKLDGLQKILKALKRKPPVAKVGILGDRNRADGISNATVGAAHEFGTSKIPMRSFLRIPLTENLNKKLVSTNLLNKDSLNEVIKKKSVVPWLEKIAIIAEGIVAEGFDTAGFGKWAPLKPETMSKKKVKQILVETQQLRNSITSEVKDEGGSE